MGQKKMSELTTLRFDDSIAWIQIDDGKVNAMSAEMLASIASRLDAAASESAVSILIGRPGMFSAGFDLRVFQRGIEAMQEMVFGGLALIEKMLRHPFPIVAACTGHAYPMGAFLMLSSDVRIGVAGDWKIGMNEVSIGLTVPHFAIALAKHRLSQQGFARISTASMFNPVEAVAAGYLDYVVPADALHQRALDTAQQLKALNMFSYATTKARLNADVLTAFSALSRTSDEIVDVA
jgi:enoyl-CoA hydratase